MSLESLAEIFGLAPPNDSHQLTLSCARCLSQITAVETDGRVRFTCSGGCTEDELIGALVEVEPAFADWWLSGGLTDEDATGDECANEDKSGTERLGDAHAAEPSASEHNARAAGLDEAGGSATTQEDENDGRRIEKGIQGTGGLDDEEHPIPDGDAGGGHSASYAPLETQTPRTEERSEASTAPKPEQREDHLQNNGNGNNGQVETARPDVFSWKMVLYELGKQGIDKLIAQGHQETIAVQELDAFVNQVEKLRNLPKIWQTNDPIGLSESEITEELVTVAVALRKHYAPQLEMPAATTPERSLIMVGNQQEAVAENAIYLSRPEIIERLGYAQTIMLIIGGKHHGKTTNFRTLALSICRNLPIWNRNVNGGPVLYMASDDELASTRNELLEMGWSVDDPLRLGRINPETLETTPEQILHEIAMQALKMKAVAIMLDMLFDFVGIRDELSYGQTRTQIGLAQKLADETGTLVVCSHHTPKYLSEFHNASNAALGSQGISARFSPIVLTRKWAEGLYTVESTTTRDPRGAELKPLRIVRNDRGWIEVQGEFKEYMKWEIYAARVLDLFENARQGLSVQSVAEKLDINRPKAQNTLKELETQGKVRREKQGRRYLYFLASTSMFDREGGQWSS